MLMDGVQLLRMFKRPYQKTTKWAHKITRNSKLLVQNLYTAFDLHVFPHRIVELFQTRFIQNNSGTSSTLETKLISRRSLNNRPVSFSASFRRSCKAPDSASCLGIESVEGDESTRCAFVS